VIAWTMHPANMTTGRTAVAGVVNVRGKRPAGNFDPATVRNSEGARRRLAAAQLGKDLTEMNVEEIGTERRKWKKRLRLLGDDLIKIRQAKQVCKRSRTTEMAFASEN